MAEGERILRAPAAGRPPARGSLLLAADLAPEGAGTRGAARLIRSAYVDPGDPLPDLPGHSSRGRLERVLRSGRFAVTSELNPPDSADPRDVYDRAVVLAEVCDAINAVDASGAHVPHVERGHLRAADPRRLRGRPADLLPRQEPHRDPGRRAGRGGHGRRQHPLPDRRRRAVRRPAGCEAGLRPRQHLAARDHPRHARRGPLPVRPQAHHAAARVPGGCRQPVRAAPRLPPAAPRQEGRAPAPSSSRPSTASTCRCSSASWRGCATSACTSAASSWSASARSPRPGPRAGCAPACRASTSPTSSSTASRRRRAPRRRARRASGSASR